jgi:apolipoprotein N-acyltransferase
MRNALCILLGAAGLWLGFPNPVAQLPLLALAYPLALLLLGLGAPGRWPAFRMGWLTGIAGSSACLYWLALPVHEYGQLPWALAVPCAVAIGAYVGLYAGLFCLLAHLTRDRLTPFRRGLFLGCAWLLLEMLRGVFLTGFPWLVLSAAFAPWPVAVQGASLVGAYGLSGLLVAVVCWAMGAMAPECGLHCPGARRSVTPSSLAQTLACALGASLVAFGLVGYGAYTLSRGLPKDGEPFRVALVQGNIDQDQKWEPAFQRATVERYLSLSKDAVSAGHPAFIVWPETAMPFYFQEHKEFGPAIRAFAAANRTPVLIGTPGYVNAPVKRGFLLYNRAMLVDEAGGDAGHYDKEHLVPFGEYAPPGLDMPFLETLMQGVGDFTPGAAVAPLRLGNLALGILICYETIFPELAQQRVADGANVLVNISNDAWFGTTAAPEQHLQLSVLRAVEQGRYVLRGTNTGISAIIDPQGRIAERGGLFRAEVIGGVATARAETTVFHRVHHLVWPVALGLAAAALLLPTRRRRA